MTTGQPEGLRLTEEEAYSILALAMTSPQGLDATSERALRKLAEYCTRTHSKSSHYHQPQSIRLSVS